MRTSSLSPASTYSEAALLLECARTALGIAGAEPLSPLWREGIDWPRLLRLALRHRVMPLLYRGLQATGPDAVLRAALDELRSHFHANAQRNLFLAGTLRTLLRLLEAHGIPAIPFKGPVLAVAVYGKLALRQFGDLDLLVRTQDASRARDLLLTQGYRWWDGRPRTLFPRLRKVYELVSADGQVLVELHWAITSPKSFFFPLNPTHLRLGRRRRRARASASPVIWGMVESVMTRSK
jgi:hypothetical protein